VRRKSKSTSQKQAYVRKEAHAAYKSLHKNLSLQSSMSMVLMDTNGVYTELNYFFMFCNPFLLIRGLSCPSRVQTSLTPNCHKLPIPGILLLLLLLNRLPPDITGGQGLKRHFFKKYILTITEKTT
jgi:hypothetical protein